MAARLRRPTISSVIAPAFAVLAMAPLMGCANYIFKTFDVDRGESLSIDARQRVVLVTHKGGKTRDRTVVCTEPSPDAISASAASAKGDAAVSFPTALPGTGSTPAQQGTTSASSAFAGASSEAAASIAMRTQTIQLLRDGLFRACEAYMNGAIDQHQYNVVLLNIDKLMITLMGVDAIGGTATTLAVAIGATPSSTSSSITSAAGQPGVKAVQAEAVANIVLSANAHSSLPGLCISLLASGELRVDNPGQHALLARCDYLLAGAVNALVTHPPTPVSQYRMSMPAPVSSAPQPPAQSMVAGWATRIDATAGGNWTAMVTAAPVLVPTIRQTQAVPPQATGQDWTTRTTRDVVAQ